jgi:hypothetical protein
MSVKTEPQAKNTTSMSQALKGTSCHGSDSVYRWTGNASGGIGSIATDRH